MADVPRLVCPEAGCLEDHPQHPAPGPAVVDATAVLGQLHHRAEQLRELAEGLGRFATYLDDLAGVLDGAPSAGDDGSA